MKKRILFYEVNPLYYKDTNDDGIGDLKGMIKQADYFAHLKIDALIIPNILSMYSKKNDSNESYKRIVPEIGSIDDFINFSKKMKSLNIKIIIDINIGSIKETHEWFKLAIKSKDDFNDIIAEPNKNEYGDLIPDEDVSSKVKIDNNTNSYYFINQQTSEVSLNWKSGKIRDMFIDVAKFWNNLGVSGFRFSNFEYIGQTKPITILEEKTTLLELRRFYRSLKNMNQNFIIIAKSEIISPAQSKILLSETTRVLDYFQPLNYSKVGLHEKYGNDLIGKFSINKLIRLIRKYVIGYESILSFGSNITGRAISRWGGNDQYNVELCKSLAILQLFYTSSPLIYYGEEIGSKNMGLTYLDDFQDSTLYERKRKFETEGINVDNFMAAQVFQNPINSHTLMAWTDKKNGGFSRNPRPIVPASHSYREINVMAQYASDSAPLNFYRKIIEFVKNEEIDEILTDGTSSIKISKFGRGIIQITHNYLNKQIIILSNISNKPRKVNQPNDFQVILSSYFNKNYKRSINVLLEYESVVLVKNISSKILNDEPILIIKKSNEVSLDISGEIPIKNTKEIIDKTDLSKNKNITNLLGKWKMDNNITIKPNKVKENSLDESKNNPDENLINIDESTINNININSTIQMAVETNNENNNDKVKDEKKSNDDYISGTIEMITNDIEKTNEMNFDDDILDLDQDANDLNINNRVDEAKKIAQIIDEGTNEMINHEDEYLEIERKQGVNIDSENHFSKIKNEE